MYAGGVPEPGGTPTVTVTVTPGGPRTTEPTAFTAFTEDGADAVRPWGPVGPWGRGAVMGRGAVTVTVADPPPTEG